VLRICSLSAVEAAVTSAGSRREEGNAPTRGVDQCAPGQPGSAGGTLGCRRRPRGLPDAALVSIATSAEVAEADETLAEIAVQLQAGGRADLAVAGLAAGGVQGVEGDLATVDVEPALRWSSGPPLAPPYEPTRPACRIRAEGPAHMPSTGGLSLHQSEHPAASNTAGHGPNHPAARPSRQDPPGWLPRAPSRRTELAYTESMIPVVRRSSGSGNGSLHSGLRFSLRERPSRPRLGISNPRQA
jgi:hypothetical protein